MKSPQRLTTPTAREPNGGHAVFLLTDSEVSVSNLFIMRKDVADYLRRFPKNEREEQLLMDFLALSTRTNG